MARKKTICLDFDGVIHKHKSAWKGPRRIPDGIVAGAIEFITEAFYQEFAVAIFSGRSHAIGGRRAMKRWLYREAVKYFDSLGHKLSLIHI